MHGRWASGWSADSGVALIEVVLVAVLVLSVAALAMPLTAHAADVSRVHAAAGFLSGRLRAARLHAVTRSAAVALVFDRSDAGWAFRVCSDGNGNGLRRADIAADRDRCEEGPYRVADMFAGVELALAPGVPGVDGETGDDEGVRFGRSAMASCSPAGHCSPGTLYLRSGGGQQYAVRVGGVTGRTRLLHYDVGSRRWEQR